MCTYAVNLQCTAKSSQADKIWKFRVWDNY
jgi:hypothetical protein